MTTMQEFKSYQNEINRFIEELKVCDDIEYATKTIKEVRELLNLIDDLKVNTLTVAEIEEVVSFVDYAKDTINNFETNLCENSEPNA